LPARAGFLQAHVSARAVDTIGHSPARARRYSGGIVVYRISIMTSHWLRHVLPWIAAASLAPLPARAQRVDVCALVSCSASGQRAAVIAEPVAQPRPRPPATSDRPTQAEPARDPWARRFQGRETEDDDVCLLNVGIGGQLAGKGTIVSHVLGRTQTWRAAAQNGH
jgi:hypothetical protein